MGPERRSCSFFGARDGVPVLFHDIEPFICYFLIRDSYFYVLFVVHCTLHASHVPSLNVLSLSFQKSHRLTLVDQDFARIQKTFIVFVVLVLSISE